MPRNTFNNVLIRRIVLILFDCCSIIISFALSRLIIASGSENSIVSIDIRSLVITILIALSTYIFTGQYKGISKYIASIDTYKIAFRNLFILFFSDQIIRFIGIPGANLGIYIINWLFLCWITISYRFLGRDIIWKLKNITLGKKTEVIVYGAGAAGAQLSSSVRLGKTYNIKAYIDDNPFFTGRTINTIPIHRYESLARIIKKQTIKEIWIAIPSITKEERNNIIKKVRKYNLIIRVVPTLVEIESGISKVERLRKISIEDLLGRSEVKPLKVLNKNGNFQKNVCVTGGGGSIGSELCKQILTQGPKKLLIIDSSEFNLYKISEDLKAVSKNNEVRVISLLSNLGNKNILEKVLKENQIETIYHAAAYKHVPLVEENIHTSIENNVIQARNLCEVAYKLKIKKLLLISSDKAVRPQNIMGTTKRIAELIFQAYGKKVSQGDKNKNENTETEYSIVRFGNVLNSSGSVVPLFRKQIEAGGPITLTDMNVTRYFMTINEAVELVLNAAMMKTTSEAEIFLLDMGEPHKIINLAKQMICLSGLKLKDKENPEGDIEIICTGLRPGEKLHEELLIGGEIISTKHPLIYKTLEKYYDFDDLSSKLYELQLANNNLDLKNTIKMLSEIVPEWKSKKYNK